MSYAKSYYGLRNPSVDQEVLNYKNEMFKKQLQHTDNELSKRLMKTKINKRFMGNGKGSIDSLISSDLETDKPIGNIMGSGITGGMCGCHTGMSGGEYQMKINMKGQGKKQVVSFDDIMSMEEKAMKPKATKAKAIIGKGVVGGGLNLNLEGGGSIDEIITIAKKHKKEMEGGKKPKKEMKAEIISGGAKKPNKWLEFVNKTRKEMGMSLKDTLKHIKTNNLYKK